MALLVSDSRTESFEKPPPPKKKWIQNYLEKDCKQQQNHLENNAFTRGVVQNVLDQVQDFIDESKKNSSSWSNASVEEYQSKKMASLLDPAHHGAKFNSSLKSLTEHQEPPSLTKQDIGGVVQGVISQFLNGNLSDSGFRRSRKRCSRHENCSGRKDHKDRKRKREVISNVGRETEDVMGSKFNQRSEGEEDEAVVLNLSLPKVAKVSFAAEDRCYSFNSFKTYISSKSQEMYKVDNARRLLAEGFQSDDTPLDFSSPSTSPILNPGAAKPAVFPSSVVNFTKEDSGPSFGIPLCPLPTQVSVLQPMSSPAAPINLVLGERRSPGVLRSPSAFSVIQPRPKDPAMHADELNKNLSRLSPKLISPPTSTHVYDTRIPDIVTAPREVGPPIVLHAAKTPPSVPGKLDMFKDRRPPVVHVVHSKSSTPRKDNFKREAGTSYKGKEKTEPSAREETKKSSSSNREMHNRLEKNRRAHLKQCFDELAKECELDPKKASNLTVIRSAYKYIMGLRRKERENEKELANLVQEKIRRKERLEDLRREVPGASFMDDD